MTFLLHPGTRKALAIFLLATAFVISCTLIWTTPINEGRTASHETPPEQPSPHETRPVRSLANSEVARRTADPNTSVRGDGKSKSLQFELDSTSRNPEVRFRAYESIHACTMAHLLSDPARTDSWLPGRPVEPFDAAACGDFQPGQLDDLQRRLALLREASLAGVHGAWFRLWQEGPNGPLRTIPNGPDYQAWEAQARAAALATGDPFVYAQEAQEWIKKDAARALTATVIYREMLTYRQGGLSFNPGVDSEIQSLASTMEPAAAEMAIAEARSFVAMAIRRATLTQRRNDEFSSKQN